MPRVDCSPLGRLGKRPPGRIEMGLARGRRGRGEGEEGRHTRGQEGLLFTALAGQKKILGTRFPVGVVRDD